MIASFYEDHGELRRLVVEAKARGTESVRKEKKFEKFKNCLMKSERKVVTEFFQLKVHQKLEYLSYSFRAVKTFFETFSS